MEKNMTINNKIKYIIFAGFVTIAMGAFGLAEVNKKIKDFKSNLIHPSEYAFDGDIATYWSIEQNESKNIIEKKFDSEINISSFILNGFLPEDSSISFFYKKDERLLPYDATKINGPVNGEVRINFPEGNRTSDTLVVKLDGENLYNIRINEIAFDCVDERTYRKILPVSYEFNFKNYLNLNAQRLWDGRFCKTWFMPIWYTPEQVETADNNFTDVYTPFYGYPEKNGEIIWQLDSEYEIDSVKVFCNEINRTIHFDYWDGISWKMLCYFDNTNEIGWNRADVYEKTSRIKISFPSGMDVAEYISQIEIWGYGNYDPATKNVLFSTEKNKTVFTYNGFCDNGIQIDIITESTKKNNESILVNVNGFDYVIESPIFLGKNQNIYSLYIDTSKLNNDTQYFSITNSNLIVDNILIKNNSSDGSYNINCDYAISNDYEIDLFDKSSIEKIILLADNDNLDLKLLLETQYFQFNNIGNGLYEVKTNGLVLDKFNVLSDCNFKINNVKIYSSILKNSHLNVEFFKTDNNYTNNSCLIGWIGDSNQSIVIDESIFPRQAGNLWWIPVNECGENFLLNDKHVLTSTLNDITTSEYFYIDDVSSELYDEILKYPLQMSLSHSLNGLSTNTGVVHISGEVGNGKDYSVTANGIEGEVIGDVFSIEYPLTEGNNVINIVCTDVSGRSVSETINVIYDVTPPDFDIIFPKRDAFISTSSTNLIIESKEENVYFNINDEGWNYSSNKLIDKKISLKDGIYDFTVQLMDLSGNVSDKKFISFCIDTVEPEHFNLNINPDNWTSQKEITISFESIDSLSGIDKYSYKLDDTLEIFCASSVKLDLLQDGIHKIEGFAYDKAGNKASCIKNIYIDTSIPNVPTNVKAIPSVDGINLYWNSENDGEGFRSYIIERIPAWANGDVILSDYGYGNLKYKDTACEDEVVYEYTIKAVDRAFNKSETSFSVKGTKNLASIDVIEHDMNVEFDGMTLLLPSNSLSENIVKVVVSQINDKEVLESVDYPLLSNVYNVSVVRNINGSLIYSEHADLKEKAIIEFDYNKSLFESKYSNTKIIPYYFDDIWNTWLPIEDYRVDDKAGKVIVYTNHFTDFSIQASSEEILTDAQMRDASFSNLSSIIGPGQINVSGESGGVSYSFTEMSLQGINGFDLNISRRYDPSDTYVEGKENNDSSSTKIKKIDGKNIWKIANKWFVNMPYLTWNGSSLWIYGFDGSAISFGQMSLIKESHNGNDVVLVYENHENTDEFVEFTFNKKSGNKYEFKGAILYQNDGNKVYYRDDGKVEKVIDSTGNNKILFDYKTDEIVVTDSIGRIVKFEYKDRIHSIAYNTNAVKYNISSDKLISSTDVSGRTWKYGYEGIYLDKNGNLIKEIQYRTETEYYSDSYGNTWSIEVTVPYETYVRKNHNSLSYIEGIGIGRISIDYRINEGHFVIVSKEEKDFNNNVVKTTNYSYEFSKSKANDDEKIISKSIVTDGKLKTVTEYNSIVKDRTRLSQSHEAIKNSTNFEFLFGSGWNKKEDLTYPSKIQTFDNSGKLLETRGYTYDTNLMRVTSQVISKVNSNYKNINEYVYDKNGNIIRTIVKYKGGKRYNDSDVNTTVNVIQRTFLDSVNYRTNLCSSETNYSFDKDIDFSNFDRAIRDNVPAVKSCTNFDYDKKGLLISSHKMLDNGEYATWKYEYDDKGQLLKSTSPEGNVTDFKYDYNSSKTNKITKIVKNVKNITDGNKYFSSDVISYTYFDKFTNAIVKSIDEDGYITNQIVDNLGRVKSKTIYKQPNDEKGENVVISVNYTDTPNSNGLIYNVVTDELGCKITTYYDYRGRLVKQTKEAVIKR